MVRVTTFCSSRFQIGMFRVIVCLWPRSVSRAVTWFASMVRSSMARRARARARGRSRSGGPVMRTGSICLSQARPHAVAPNSRVMRWPLD